NLHPLVNNRVIARGLQQVAHDIETGRTLTQSFEQTGLFPPLVVRMLKIGETTGALDEALLNVSYFYDREAKQAVQRLQVMIEPALTLILGALLGWVMLAVLSPIYDLIGKLRL
ncbi:MAG: type IV pilus assembly protein PilC, partial [Hyphomonadaceae bacterium]